MQSNGLPSLRRGQCGRPGPGLPRAAASENPGSAAATNGPGTEQRFPVGSGWRRASGGPGRGRGGPAAATCGAAGPARGERDAGACAPGRRNPAPPRRCAGSGRGPGAGRRTGTGACVLQVRGGPETDAWAAARAAGAWEDSPLLSAAPNSFLSKMAKFHAALPPPRLFQSPRVAPRRRGRRRGGVPGEGVREEGGAGRRPPRPHLPPRRPLGRSF